MEIFNYLLVVIDILLVAYIIYRLLLLIKGTRAVQMLIGLSLIIILFFIAKVLHFVTLQWILGNFLSSIILVIIVIFQEEIRRALTKVGIRPFFFGSQKKISDKTLEDLIVALKSLSQEKTGALIVLQNEVGLDDYLEEGVSIDATFSKKLLISLFQKSSSLHDGAVIIDRDRIVAAGCILPLSLDPELDPSLGTRHRAALGLSEKTDAVVLVVSEENGSISLIQEGKMLRNLDLAGLKEALNQTFLANKDKQE